MATTIPPIVKALTVICYEFAETGMLWTVKAKDGEIFMVDERTGMEKVRFKNLNGIMRVLAYEIEEKTWDAVKQIYLKN